MAAVDDPAEGPGALLVAGILGNLVPCRELATELAAVVAVNAVVDREDRCVLAGPFSAVALLAAAPIVGDGDTGCHCGYGREAGGYRQCCGYSCDPSIHDFPRLVSICTAHPDAGLASREGAIDRLDDASTRGRRISDEIPR